MQKPFRPPAPLTTEEAADMLRTSPATIRTYVKRGWLKGVRVGRRLLIEWQSVNNALIYGLPLPDPLPPQYHDFGAPGERDDRDPDE